MGFLGCKVLRPLPINAIGQPGGAVVDDLHVHVGAAAGEGAQHLDAPPVQGTPKSGDPRSRGNALKVHDVTTFPRERLRSIDPFEQLI